MASTRNPGRIAGVWFLLTFVFSIPALWFYAPVLHHHNYILGSGDDTRVAIGALLEVLLVIANIATAVVFFPVLKRQSERFALGYLASRIVESVIIVVGLLSLMAVVTLRQDLHTSVGNTDSLVIAGRSLLAVHNWTFLVGPSFCAGVGNGILLGYLMYRSGLVPRRMAMIGLVGGPLAFLASALAILGAYHLGSTPQALLTVPEIIWEASLAIYLIVKGYRPSSILDRTIDLTGTMPAQAAPQVKTPAVR
jgi:hypothetical protein